MATMNDVAKLAGVSRGTVSNYINGVTVKTESQKKIRAAIAELKYIPNTAARQLKTSRSNLVVFIIPTTRTPLFSELTYKVQQDLQAHGFKMILCNSNNDIQEELEYIQMAKMQKAAGIITMSYSDLLAHVSSDLPVVSIEKQIADTISCISADNYQGGRIAAAQLHRSGAKKLLLVSRLTEKTKSNYGIRVRGFEDYCHEHQLDYHLFSAPVHEEEFYKQLDAFLHDRYAYGVDYDGIFTVADQYADFTENVLRALGVTAPKQVQIIGFDGGKMYPNQPRHISSIRQPVDKIAMKCVENLEKILSGEKVDVAPLTLLPVKFVQGQTTN
ncbi:LacI family DNA-binding transcriptional regulator [Lacticaseibacillus paracasei]|uniref:LacI family DNA-binding transcriptional regulator n=1 Tax=Lacticaseibacillus paracasei TaxID=1597 RepID=UPI0002977B1C|nr:LacI family DNA-binding transcriptional regulator [Lacticaseibacillus paracasei]EKP96553.1 multiple sugar metabolism (MSM) regulatory protein [Lacticaseibacillus paracasei]WBS98884.1 LacI family DNA-binding transcriptional regulator [Lacticaseibacillus paracasei]